MMSDRRSTYTVGRLAKLAGVSVQTLRHYDTIGLLTPTSRTDARYRQYDEADLLRLQQIMFYRELGVPLKTIASLMDTDDYDAARALERHRDMLVARKIRTETLITTIDKTISALRGHTMLTDEELYEGFTKEEIETLKGYEKEAAETWDPAQVAESQRRVRSMSKARWQEVKDESNEITRLLASLMNHDPSSPEAQEATGRHFAHLHHFYTPTTAMYRGLGEMYAADPRFRAHYDAYAAGLADFIKAAIVIFCDRRRDSGID